MRKCAITIIALALAHAHRNCEHQLITYLAPPQSASIFLTISSVMLQLIGLYVFKSLTKKPKPKHMLENWSAANALRVICFGPLCVQCLWSRWWVTGGSNYSPSVRVASRIRQPVWRQKLTQPADGRRFAVFSGIWCGGETSYEGVVVVLVTCV